LRDDERKLQGVKATREEQWCAGDMDAISEVGEEQIAAAGDRTGIPAHLSLQPNATSICTLSVTL